MDEDCENTYTIDRLVSLLPKELADNPSLLTDVLNEEAWKLLSTEQQECLNKLLPFKGKDLDVTRQRLFNGERACCGWLSSMNAVDDAVNKIIHHQSLTPAQRRLEKDYDEMMAMRAEAINAHRIYDLMQRALVERELLMQGATVKSVPHAKAVKRRKEGEERNRKVMTKANITKFNNLTEVSKQELELEFGLSKVDLETSSSSEDERGEDRKFVYAKCNKQRKFDLRAALHRYAKRKKQRSNAKKLKTGGMELAEKIRRTAVKNKIKSSKPEDSKNEDTGTSLMETSAKAALPKGSKARTAKNRNAEKQALISPSCFFELIKELMKMCKTGGIDELKELVEDWLTSAQATTQVWTTARSDWTDLLQKAVTVLHDIGKIVVRKSGEGSRKTSKGDDGDEDDASLCYQWTDEKSELYFDDEDPAAMKEACQRWIANQDDCEPPPPPTFHQQEATRFAFPHQPFVYRCPPYDHHHSRRHVPPVEGGCSGGQHALLRPDRPSRATLVALTRDAVARLPPHLGTKQDVYEYVKQSQYVEPDANPEQLTQAVNSALDRLKAGWDKRVRFEACGKRWSYIQPHDGDDKHGNDGNQQAVTGLVVGNNTVKTS